jgi:hypothetical protein
VLPAALFDHHQPKAVSLDGGMVNLRRDGWRELKGGAGFDLDTRLEPNPQTQPLDQLAHGVNVHDTAVLGSKDDFTPALWSLAVEPDGLTAPEPAVMGDGRCGFGRWQKRSVPLTADSGLVSRRPSSGRPPPPCTRMKTTARNPPAGSRSPKPPVPGAYSHPHRCFAPAPTGGFGYFERHQRRMPSLNFGKQASRWVPARWKVGSNRSSSD